MNGAAKFGPVQTRLAGWPLAVIATVFYTTGMGFVWLFAHHDDSETAWLMQDVILALAVLVLLTVLFARWVGMPIYRSGRLGWFGWLALLPAVLSSRRRRGR